MATAPVKMPIRVVVVDDSAYNRQSITQMLETDPEVQVVGRAADGDDGLKQVFQHQPDVVTLDLEMPKMDGFTFLRILMSRHATPVLVISSYAAKQNVFKALELGALDFIAKPGQKITPDLRAIQSELLTKVKLVRQLRVVSLTERAAGAVPATFPPGGLALPEAGQPVIDEPFRVIAIGASTGGPPALQQLLASLDPTLRAAVVITQHMPAKFTRAFAERLCRFSPLPVKEAEEGDPIRPGRVLVAPGSGSLIVDRDPASGGLRAHIEPQGPNDRFLPSVDAMFTSAAETCGPDVLAVVLTGMGGDSGRGVRAVKAKKGQVIVEAPETAVIFGMPQEAIATGMVDDVLPLGKIPEAISTFARRR